jgi:2-polyprenyl-3-methyl-5-hydroxy-6-metoxy-1,4-benzoquinol methylase
MIMSVTPETVSNSVISIVAAPRCWLCGARGAKLYDATSDWLWGVPGEWGLRHCECGLAWLDPQPCATQLAKLYAKYYTHSGTGEPRRLDRIRREIMQCVLARMGYPVQPSTHWLARFLSHIPSIARARALEIFDLPPTQAGTLLDVGCGNGKFIRQMRSLGWDASGVDPDPAAVAQGLRAGLNVFQGSIIDLPPDPRYDVITLNHVIEHVPDPIFLLAECKRRLIPFTGRIMIMTPNLNSLGHRWFGRFWRGLEIPRHLMLFSSAALTKCVSRAGLTVKSLSTETRLARMIYNPSACAKTGESRIGEKTNFKTSTKASAFLFQAIEDLWIQFRKDAGEELFCVCSAE